jgi:capsular polysaccharide export protein
MPQCDLASAMAVASCNEKPGLSRAPAGSALLQARSGLREAASFSALLPDFRVGSCFRDVDGDRVSGVLAWAGARGEGREKGRAAALGIPFLRLGPGLLRAPPGWGRVRPVLSATAHEVTGPSTVADILDSGRLLLTQGWEDPGLLARAARARRDTVSQRLGGPWWNSGATSELPRNDGFTLLVIDNEKQCGAKGSFFPALPAMVAAALAESGPEKIVLVASCPSGRLRRLSGSWGEAIARGCTVLTRPVDLWAAIQRAKCVYAAGGEAGFLALLAGASVRCFADSFYSGWGITSDEPGVRQKPFRRTIDEILAGACLIATRYLDPYHQTATSFEQILAIVGEWRKIEADNRRITVCLGMSLWKRRQIADFLRSHAGKPAFRRTARAAFARARIRSGGAIAVWASRAPTGLAKAAECRGIPVIRVEDGFIRSVGLGSDFMPAASIVLDRRGMHFDPSVRSDLETLLIETEFDRALLDRAQRLMTGLVTRGVTKYNLGKQSTSIEWPPARRRILVPGQVEDDLSVRLGNAGVTGNLDLLTRVRRANPDAFIAYKPHPDIEAGHRRGKIPDAVALDYADIIIRDVSTAAVLAEIEELHTLTSLAGFEALLRHRLVTVYGTPFYAGWGLTTDFAAIDRGRRLSVEELVAGALILYPRYLDPVTRLPCGPEIVIERLDNPELWKPGPLVVARRLQGLLSRCWNELTGWVPKFLADSSHDASGTPQP